MNNELIILLQKAYDDGIITSIIQAKITKAKTELNLSDADFQKIDDQIRITTYLRKVEERKTKGDVYIGDLTKQYKITEEEKILLKEKKPVEQKPVPPIIQAEQPVESKSVLPITQEKKPDEPKIIPQITQKQKPVKSKSIPPITQEHPPVEPKQDQPIMQTQQTTKTPVSESVGNVVLIVDDNPVHIALTKKCLEKNGYICHTADSPETAFKLAIQITPSIVLCDFNFGIGKQTGLDLFQELKSKKIIVPFIIISAYYQKEFVDYAFGIGVTDYLTKPFEPEILLSTVKQHLTVKKSPENNE
jgi:CheY-like chemotaxis protein